MGKRKGLHSVGFCAWSPLCPLVSVTALLFLSPARPCKLTSNENQARSLENWTNASPQISSRCFSRPKSIAPFNPGSPSRILLSSLSFEGKFQQSTTSCSAQLTNILPIRVCRGSGLRFADMPSDPQICRYAGSPQVGEFTVLLPSGFPEAPPPAFQPTPSHSKHILACWFVLQQISRENTQANF